MTKIDISPEAAERNNIPIPDCIRSFELTMDDMVRVDASDFADLCKLLAAIKIAAATVSEGDELVLHIRQLRARAQASAQPPEPSEKPAPVDWERAKQLREKYGLEFTVNGDGDLTRVTVHGEVVWTCGKLAAPHLREALKTAREVIPHRSGGGCFVVSAMKFCPFCGSSLNGGASE